MIERLAKEGCRWSSHLLHAPNDGLRGRIMPVNRSTRWRADEGLPRLRENTKRLITFEHPDPRGERRPEQARELASCWPPLQGEPDPVPPDPRRPFARPPMKRMLASRPS